MTLYVAPEFCVLFVWQGCRCNKETAGAALSFVEGGDLGTSGRKKTFDCSYLATQNLYQILIVLFLSKLSGELELRVGDVGASGVSPVGDMVILQLAASVGLRNAQMAFWSFFQ